MGGCWSSDEIAILQQHYNNAQKSDIEALLPKRSWNAIQSKAERLGFRHSFSRLPCRKEPNTADLAYFAGLFDGEGCILIQSHYKYKLYKREAYQLKIMVSNTYLPTLEWVKHIWGFGSISLTKGKKGQKVQGQWYTGANLAAYVLKLISPYLQIKKQEAEIAITFQEMKSKAANFWGRSYIPNKLYHEEKRLANLLCNSPTRKGNI